MVFDIRDEVKAAFTLERLTGVYADTWIKEKLLNIDRFDYRDVNNDIKKLIYENGGHYPNLHDIELVLTHITTRGSDSDRIKNAELRNLKEAYLDKKSELREFLEYYNIEINLDDCCLYYDGNNYDISHEDCQNDEDSLEYKACSIGRKFYYDYAVCGFLSISPNDEYGGGVHRRPEILWNLDELLGTSLQDDWINSHEPYEIVFKIPALDTANYGKCVDNNEEQNVMELLIQAFMCVLNGPSTIDIICKDDVSIKPEQILECNEFTKWN